MPKLRTLPIAAKAAEPNSATVEFLSRRNYSGALSLGLLAFGNFLLLYIINILLARKLPVSDFDDYSVAVSVVAVLSTVATLGLEKYALRCIPVYRERGDWSHLRGFWRFSFRTIIPVSIALALLLSVSLEAVLVSRHADRHLAVIVFAGLLPMVAAVLFLVEVATATGAQIQAVVIYRFLFPAGFFVLLNVTRLFGILDTAVSVGVCYGAAWLLALVAIYSLVRDSMPHEVWRSEPAMLPKKWLRRGAPFLLNSWMLSVMASSGVIILQILFTSDAAVGTYAVAAQTGTFIVLLANTTNRFYLPLMSLYLERRDRRALERLMWHRMAVVGGLSMLFISVVVLFGRDILGWFGPNFEGGYAAVCVLAAGAAVNALFSDSPYYLQFMKHERSVFMSTGIGVIINLALTGVLGYRFGVLGAAVGYSVSMSLVFLVLRIHASRHFKSYWTGTNCI